MKPKLPRVRLPRQRGGPHRTRKGEPHRKRKHKKQEEQPQPWWERVVLWNDIS